MNSNKLAGIVLAGLTVFVVVVISISALIDNKKKEPLTDNPVAIKNEEQPEVFEHTLICNIDNENIDEKEIELYMWTHDTNEGQKLYIQNNSDYYINIKLCYEDEEDDYFWLTNYNYQGTTIAPSDINLLTRTYGFHQQYTFDYIRTNDRATISQPSKDGGLSTQGYSLCRVCLYIYSSPYEELSHIATVWLAMEDVEIE